MRAGVFFDLLNCRATLNALTIFNKENPLNKTLFQKVLLPLQVKTYHNPNTHNTMTNEALHDLATLVAGMAIAKIGTDKLTFSIAPINRDGKEIYAVFWTTAKTTHPQIVYGSEHEDDAEYILRALKNIQAQKQFA